MKDEQAIREAAHALAEAFKTCAKALALFVITALTFLFRILAELFHVLRAAFALLCGLVPALIRMLAVCAVAVAMVIAWPSLFMALGGDFIAALPASAFCIVPVAYMLHMERGVAGLFAAALIVFSVGVLFPALPIIGRGVVIACVMGATVALQIQHIGEKDNEEQERTVLGVVADDSSAVFQRDEERQFDFDYHAE